jgi:hypothetical protein
LNGQDPTAVNLSDPIRLWIIQVCERLTARLVGFSPLIRPIFSGIIVCTASLLSLLLRKLRQPKVIAEVIGGIILGKNHYRDWNHKISNCHTGPTAFGQHPQTKMLI